MSSLNSRLELFKMLFEGFRGLGFRMQRLGLRSKFKRERHPLTFHSSTCKTRSSYILVSPEQVIHALIQHGLKLGTPVVPSSVETEYVLRSTAAQENSAFARCCVLGFAAA